MCRLVTPLMMLWYGLKIDAEAEEMAYNEQCEHENFHQFDQQGISFRLSSKKEISLAVKLKEIIECRKQ